MLLTRILKDITSKPRAHNNLAALLTDASVRKVLNVGGGSTTIGIPEHYRDWRQLMLDIDPKSGAQIVMDARKLMSLPDSVVDAVYCSHNLEHYYLHDVKKVLAGFLHVLKPDGFAEIHVPDIEGVMTRFVTERMDIHDTLYQSPRGPITVHDVVYGHGEEIEHSGVDFYAHKTGFTKATLEAALLKAGFTQVYMGQSEDNLAIGAMAFRSKPTAAQCALLQLEPA